MKGLFSAILFAVAAAGLVSFNAALGLVVVGLWLGLLFVGRRRRASDAEALLRSTLIMSEALVAEAWQHRLFGLFGRRKLVALTDRRVIIMTRGLLGGFKLSWIELRDLDGVRLRQNPLPSVLGANLRFFDRDAEGAWMSIDGIDPALASTIHARVATDTATVLSSPVLAAPLAAGSRHHGAVIGLSR